MADPHGAGPAAAGGVADVHPHARPHGGELEHIYEAALEHHDATIAGHDIAAFAPARRSSLLGLMGAAISLALLAAVGWQLHRLDFARVLALIPHAPLFWVVFFAAYMVPPSLEWLIYHRLFGLSLSGLAALLRKTVSNELLLGYLGEVQFYAWVRGRLNNVVAPFGAIKDTTILSALTGNLATLALLGPAWPIVASGAMGAGMRRLFIGLGVVLAVSLAILLFRRKIFTLPRRLLLWIAGIHCVRIVAVVVLCAVMWHIALPAVPIGQWLVLATVRMLISRVPLLPNKDFFFAGVAVALLGNEADIANLMTMMAGLQLAMHLAVGGSLAIADLVTTRVERT